MSLCSNCGFGKLEPTDTQAVIVFKHLQDNASSLKPMDFETRPVLECTECAYRIIDLN